MKAFVKDNFDLHAWTGVLCAALLFVVAFSGAVALFEEELATWENPERRRAFVEDSHGIDAHLAAIRTKASFDFDEFFLTTPTVRQPYFTFWSFDRETRETTTVLTDPGTKDIIEAGDSEIAHHLAHLHTDLHLPRPYGRYLVGLTGVVMMLLLATGVFTHRKILKELFVLRRGGSLRAFFSSSHKLLGVWGLPFHLMMAFTGAIIGLLGIIGVFMALASYGGSVEKAAAAFLGPRAEPVGETAAMLPIEGFVGQTEARWEGFRTTFIKVEAYGDEGSQITVSGNVPGRLAMSTGVTYNSASGEVVHVQDWHGKGLPTLLFGMVVPLHYATYGGVLLKYLYLVLGAGMAFLIVTGTGIWLERRERSRQRAGVSGVSFLTRFHIGVSAGLMAATSSLFLFNHLLSGTMLPTVFWAVWGMAILYAMLRNRITQTVRLQVSLAGAALIGAALVNTVVTGDAFWRAPSQGLYPVMIVDLSLIFSGLLMLGFVWYRKLRQPVTQPSVVPTEAESY